MKRQCSQYDNQQCRATKDLTACVMSIKQGFALKGPEKVVVLLCPKHFQLNISKAMQPATERGDARGPAPD